MIETTEFSVEWHNPSDDVSITYTKINENLCICTRIEERERITNVSLENGVLKTDTLVLSKREHRWYAREYLNSRDEKKYCRSNLRELKNALPELKPYMPLEFVQLIESLIEN